MAEAKRMYMEVSKCDVTVKWVYRVFSLRVISDVMFDHAYTLSIVNERWCTAAQ